MEHQFDAIVVGAGLAGLRAAIEIGEDSRVAVISKVFATRSHSGAAQGGIGAALGNEEEDNWEWHMFDTVKGSDYLGDQDAIETMAKDAPRTIYELEHLGVPFNRTGEGKIAQRAFGGHTSNFGKAPVKRACFAADRTGRVILDTLWEQSLQRDIKFFDEYHVLSLVVEDGRCCGIGSTFSGCCITTQLPLQELVLRRVGIERNAGQQAHGYDQPQEQTEHQHTLAPQSLGSQGE